MGASVHDDVALEPLALTGVVENRDAAGALDNAKEVAPERGGQVWNRSRQAPVSEAAVFRAVVPVHPAGVVARRQIREMGRRRGVVLSAGARRRLVLARVC